MPCLFPFSIDFCFSGFPGQCHVDQCCCHRSGEYLEDFGCDLPSEQHCPWADAAGLGEQHRRSVLV